MMADHSYLSISESVQAVFNRQQASFRTRQQLLEREKEVLIVTIRSLEDELTWKSTRIGVLEKELQVSQSRCSATEQRNELLSKEVISLKRRQLEDINIKAELERNSQTLKYRLDMTVAELQKALDEKTEQFAHLVSNGEEKKRSSQQTFTRLQDRVEELQNQLTARDAELKQLQNNVCLKDAELCSLRNRLLQSNQTEDNNLSTESVLAEKVRLLSEELETIRNKEACRRNDHELYEEIGSMRTLKLLTEEKLQKALLERAAVSENLAASETEVAQLKQEIVQLNALLKSQEEDEQTTYMHLLNDMSTLKQQKADIRCKNRELQREVFQLKQQLNEQASSKNKFDELLKQLDDENMRVTKAQDMVHTLTEQNEQLKTILSEQEHRIENVLQRQITLLEERIATLTTRNEEVKREAEKGMNERMMEHQLTLQALKEQDGQLDELSQVLKQYKDKTRAVLEEQRTLETAVENERQSSAALQKEMQKLVQERNMLLHQIEALKQEVSETNEDCKEELTDALTAYNSERNEYISTISCLEETNNSLGEKVHNLELQLATSNQQMERYRQEQFMLRENTIYLQTENQRLSERLETENQKLSERCDQLQDALNSVTTTELKLKQGLQEAVQKLERYRSERDTFMSERDRLSMDLQQQKADFDIEKHKLNSTIAQQLKLISFLQDKGAGAAMAPRTFGKSYEPESPLVKRTLEARGTPRARAAEGKVEPDLIMQTQPRTPRQYIVGPCSSTSAQYGSSSSALQNEGHALVPHKWKGSFIIQAWKCASCWDILPFLRYSLKCQNCKIYAHRHCADVVPLNCGLLSSRGTNADNFSFNDLPAVGANGSVEGWLKYLNSNHDDVHWKDVWAMLDDGVLKFYSSTDGRLLLDSIDFSEDWQLRFRPITGSISQREFPFVLTVVASRRNIIYMKPTSVAAKEVWLDAIEKATRSKSALVRRQCDLSIASAVVLNLEDPQNLHIRRVQFYNHKAILGCEEGLFVAALDYPSIAPKLIAQVEVFQLEILQDVATVVLTITRERKLAFMQLAELDEVCSRMQERKLCKITQISQYGLIHCLCYGHVEEQPALCLADPDRVLLMRYNNRLQIFTEWKSIPTTEPSNCLSIFNNFFLVGEASFRRISLPAADVSEFLDSTDESLVQLIADTAIEKNYPIAIVQISPGNSDLELLLCFETFGVFCDERGRRTRDCELEFIKTVQEIMYTNPYLIISHFSSVEIFDVPPVSLPNAKPRSLHLLELTNPRIVGSEFYGDVFIACTKLNITELLKLTIGRGEEQVAARDKRKVLASFNEAKKVKFS